MTSNNPQKTKQSRTAWIFRIYFVLGQARPRGLVGNTDHTIYAG